MEVAGPLGTPLGLAARLRGGGDGQQQGVLRDPTGQGTWALSLVTHSCRPGLWPIPQGADTHSARELRVGLGRKVYEGCHRNDLGDLGAQRP